MIDWRFPKALGLVCVLGALTFACSQYYALVFARTHVVKMFDSLAVDMTRAARIAGLPVIPA